MELQKLRYFQAVARMGHMTRAAESIRIAQPALSQAIHSLERELGAELFVKKGRNIVLTEYGEYLKNRLDAILPEIDGLSRELAELKQRLVDTVKLNILAASGFVIDAIVAYRKENPQAVFEFEQNARKYDCDIVIKLNGKEKSAGQKPTLRCVKTEQVSLAVPKNSHYASMKGVELSKLREEGFVMLSGSRMFGILCREFCSRAGFEPKILFESDSPAAVQNIISTGAGVAFWPEFSWGGVNNENVTLLPISSPECKRELVIEFNSRLPKSRYAEDFYRYLIRRM